MPRVLHVPCDLAGGGAERMVLELARRSSPGFVHHVAPLHATGSLRPAFQAAGVPIHDLRRVRGRPGLRATLRLAALCRDYDLVHTHLWAGDTWGRLGAGLAQHPAVVVTEHNTRAEAPWRQALSVRLHPLCRVVVAVSPAAAEGLVAAGLPPDRIRVIANGIDLDRFRPLPPRSGPPRVVLGLGRLEPQKGFDLAARAVAGLPGLRLVLAGEGSQGPALAAAGALLRGWQPDVLPLLAEADIVVVPSRWEGFGLAAVEALACGLPVVAADVPGLREVVGDAALLVPPEDPVALAGALRRLVEEPALRARLAQAGPVQAARFSLDATVAAYEALYSSLLPQAATA